MEPTSNAGQAGGTRSRLRVACAVILLVAVSIAAGGAADGAPGGSAGASVSAEFSGLVRIGKDRKLYLTCRGNGRPTVILISGFRGAYDDWTHVVPRSGGEPVPSGSSVFSQVANSTRVCAFDRPGTVNFAGEMTPSTPVRQPTTANDDAADLNALLRAPRVPGPYVLVAHSWGGMGTYRYASMHSAKVAGLVMLDSGSTFLKSALTPGQWHRFVRGGRALGDPRTLEAVDYARSVRQIRAGRSPRRVPSAVLSSDHRFDFGAGPGTWPAWLVAQKRLAAKLRTRHISDTDSGHYIAGERPRLVTGQIRRVVRRARASTRRHHDRDNLGTPRINWKPSARPCNAPMSGCRWTGIGLADARSAWR
jgi:pimeloyl-ACP methyl ester carboxylesterase